MSETRFLVHPDVEQPRRRRSMQRLRSPPKPRQPPRTPPSP
ncbi:hypothetical protein [Halopenitus persicus]|nr:hypothetical protein [Halopenitus persicus]